MKTKLEIFLDAQALASQTLGDTDTMEIDGKVWDAADSKGHRGKDFELFKSDFRNLRNTMLTLKKLPAPSEQKQSTLAAAKSFQDRLKPGQPAAIKTPTIQTPVIKK